MKNKNIGAILLSLLVIIEPLLDTYVMYNNPNLEFFGFKFSTIIRYGIIAILGIFLIIKTKLKEKRKLLVVYGILVILYLIMHHINALNFTSLVPDNFSYNLLEEIWYILRYLIIIFIIYYMYSTEISNKNFKNSILTLSLIISLSIIISNIFYLARSSYFDYTISHNIIDWFTKDISFATASTRGFFYATIVITNLLLITPYIYYLYLKDGKYKYLTLIVFNFLALFMAGTKACTFGFIIIAIIMPIMYLFFTIFKKEYKFKISRFLATVTIICASFLILPSSPAVQRIYLTSELNSVESEIPKPNNEVNDKEDNDDSEKEDSVMDLTQFNSFEDIYYLKNAEERERAIKQYISNNTTKLGISTNLLNAYSYNYDYEFWANIILNESSAKKSDNRYIQTKIFNRIKEINNNSLDNFFGLTYSRTSKIFNLERDFQYQYYSLGLIGVILFLMPLVILLLVCMIYILIKRKNLTLENCSLCLGIGLIICIAAYSGNMLDNLGITIPLGYTLGYLVSKIFRKREKKSEF